MSYELEFDRRALKEWRKLTPDIRQQFKKKLARLVQNPHAEANKLRELPGCYKIKLCASGYRLIYQVIDHELVVLVVAIGKRDKSKAYRKATARLPRQK